MRLYYEAALLRDRPTIVLGSSLGTTTEMWNPQFEELKRDFNIIMYDLPGHGLSPDDRDYETMENLASFVLDLIKELDVGGVIFCGLSIGGAIGQILAAEHPEYIDRLILASTGVRLLAPEAWRERITAVLGDSGMEWIVARAPSRHFTERFRQQNDNAVQDVIRWLRAMRPEAYARACGTLERFDGENYVQKIQCPTLIIAGQSDIAITPDNGVELSHKIRDSEIQLIPDAAHLCNLESPALFNRLVYDFVTQ